MKRVQSYWHWLLGIGALGAMLGGALLSGFFHTTTSTTTDYNSTTFAPEDISVTRHGSVGYLVIGIGLLVISQVVLLAGTIGWGIDSSGLFKSLLDPAPAPSPANVEESA